MTTGSHKGKIKSMMLLLIIICGDIETNPGPTRANTYPCGICNTPVTWSRDGICCDHCSIWMHRSCLSMGSADYNLLARSNVSWICHRCDSINISSFIYHQELPMSNSFAPLSPHLLSPETEDSLNYMCLGTPISTSTPKSNRCGDGPQCNQTEGRSKFSVSKLQNDFESSNDPLTSENHSTSSETETTGNRMKKTNLRIVSFNCQSILKKSSSLAVALDQTKPDVICGTESWLSGIKPGKDPSKTAIKSSEIFPPQYRIYRNDRESTHPGGGVFIGIHESLEPWTVEKPDFVNDCEINWCKIHLPGKKPLFIGCFYMAHRNVNDLEKLNESLENIKIDAGKNIILCGDFNCPDIDWEKQVVQKSPLSKSSKIRNPRTQELLMDVATNHYLTQVHQSKTRENQRLDLVFTSNESLITSSISIPGISDHDMLVTDTMIKPPIYKKPPRKHFKFHKANWEKVNEEIRKMHPNITKMKEEGANIEEIWTYFRNSLKDLIDQYVPHRMNRETRTSLPWVNAKIKKMLKRKAKLFRKAREQKDWTRFRKFQNFCRKTLREAEWEYVNRTIKEGFESNNSKPFWKFIKAKRQDNTGIAPLNSPNGLQSEPEDKANVLVEQFKSVFNVQKYPNKTPKMNPNIKDPLRNIHIHQMGVRKLLQNIKVTKAIGPDGIPNQILKECATSLSPTMTCIFQMSLDTGTLPKDWLDANVAPIFKKGDKQQAENYRPVSLTSVSCKTLEHIVCKSLLNHLEDHQILTPLNHGFRSGHSCETQLIVTIQDLMSSYDAKKQVDVAILDFSKAFDTVPHSKLLEILKKYGVDGTLHDWFRCFLTERQMKVVVDGKSSRAVYVASGVPQGTVLGPILFLCHINSLPENIRSQVRLFADDCLIYRQINSQKDHAILQEDLKNLEVWAQRWGMQFNARKCYILSVGAKSTHFYQLCGHILKNVNQNPYLGVLLSDDLKWAPHIGKIASKASATLGILRRNLRACPQDCKRLAYITLVRSTLEYSASVWDPHLQKDIDQLERVQRKAVRFIANDYASRNDGFITNKMKELELLPLQERRKIIRLTLLYKIINKQMPAIDPKNYIKGENDARPRKIPSHLNDYLTDEACLKNVRNNTQCLQRINGSSKQYTSSYFPRTIIDWNNLNDKIVSKPTVKSFRDALLREA